MRKFLNRLLGRNSFSAIIAPLARIEQELAALLETHAEELLSLEERRKAVESEKFQAETVHGNLSKLLKPY